MLLIYCYTFSNLEAVQFSITPYKHISLSRFMSMTATVLPVQVCLQGSQRPYFPIDPRRFLVRPHKNTNHTSEHLQTIPFFSGNGTAPHVYQAVGRPQGTVVQSHTRGRLCEGWMTAGWDKKKGKLALIPEILLRAHNFKLKPKCKI